MVRDETYLTKEGLEKTKKELDYLINTKRKQVIERIQIAKSYGDLSENAEYESAKSEQSFIEGRIEEIQEILRKVKIIKKKGNTKVSMGSRIIVGVDGHDEEYEIVGSSEADPSQNKISDESPTGKAILDKKIGDAVEVEVPDGKITYKIKKIL